MKKEIRFDAKDLIRSFQDMFASLAGNHDGKLDKKATKRNVEVCVGKNSKEGQLRVRFMTKDKFFMVFSVDVGEFITDHKKYTEGMMFDLAEALKDAKSKRKLEKPIVLLA